MKISINYSTYLYCLLFILAANNAVAQKIITGYVYEDKYRTPIDSVRVYTQSGYHTQSNELGKYSIPTNGKEDSIWFNYNNKNTRKYSIDTIKNLNNFEVQIYLPESLRQNHFLPTVTVRTRDYLQDSLSLRRDYAKIFDYKKPMDALGEGVSVTPMGIGVDLDAVINLFRFGYNKRQEVYHKFALQIEQDHYIDHRYTKKLVEDITGLYDKERDAFMIQYRPGYDELLMMNELQLAKYIQLTYQQYLRSKQKQKVEKNIFLPPNLQK